MLVRIIGSILGTTCLRAEIRSFRSKIRHIPSRCSMANWSVLRRASRKHPRSPDHRPCCRAVWLPTHHARRPYRFDRIPLHSILRCQHPNASRWLPLARCKFLSRRIGQRLIISEFSSSPGVPSKRCLFPMLLMSCLSTSDNTLPPTSTCAGSSVKSSLLVFCEDWSGTTPSGHTE